MRIPNPPEILGDDDDDGTMPENVATLAHHVVGHRIVSAEERPIEHEWRGTISGLVITLDNGREVRLADSDDCCAFTELESFLLHADMVDHRLVRLAPRPAAAPPDGAVVGTYQIIDPAQPRVVIDEIDILGQSVTDWSANLRYTTRRKIFGQNTRMTFQLNANNLFRSDPELLTRRYSTIVVAPGVPLPAPGAPNSSFILAPRTVSGSVKFSF